MPALSSKARSDCVDAALNGPQDLGTDAIHRGCGVGIFGLAAYILNAVSPAITSATVATLWLVFFTASSGAE